MLRRVDLGYVIGQPFHHRLDFCYSRTESGSATNVELRSPLNTAVDMSRGEH